jgi:protein SCO1
MKPGLCLFVAGLLIGMGASAVRADWAADALAAQQKIPAAYRNVGVDEHLNAQLPLDLRFYDEKAQKVTLGDMFHHDRPVILQLGYLQCPMLCDQVSRGLVESAKKIDLNIGQDFDFLFVSIDPTDSPDLAQIKLNNYAAAYGKPGSASGFHFLVGKQDQIEQLAAAVGFRYQPAHNGQFAHPAVAMVITPDGKIARYLYGLNFPPETLRLSLVEASHGKIGSSIDQVLLICLSFDPATGKYSMAAINLMKIGGIVTLMVLGGAIFWMVRHGSHARPIDEEAETN